MDAEMRQRAINNLVEMSMTVDITPRNNIKDKIFKLYRDVITRNNNIKIELIKY